MLFLALWLVTGFLSGFIATGGTLIVVCLGEDSYYFGGLARLGF